VELTSLKAGYGALRHPAGNEVLPLWEWLPATIIAARCRSHRKTTSLEVLKFGGEFLVEPANPRRRKGIEGLDLLIAVQCALHHHAAVIESLAVAAL